MEGAGSARRHKQGEREERSVQRERTSPDSSGWVVLYRRLYTIRGLSFQVAKVKPTCECLNPAIYITASRGRLRWLQIDISAFQTKNAFNVELSYESNIEHVSK